MSASAYPACPSRESVFAETAQPAEITGVRELVQPLHQSADMALSRRERWIRFFRATIAGAAATLTDLLVLAVLVSGLGLRARVANVPALLAGGTVNFLGNRHFAFRATEGSVVRQAVLYALVELVALGLNGVLYDQTEQALALHGAPSWSYLAVRLVTSNVVFLFWSYPLWRGVFRTPVPQPAA